MPRISLQPDKPQWWFGRYVPRKGQAFGCARHPGAGLPDIHIDQERKRRVIRVERCGEIIDLRRMIDDRRERRASMQLDQPPHLLRAHHGRSDQHVLDTGGNHVLGLAEGGAGNAKGARLQLLPRNIRGLVGFRMWSQGHAGPPRGCRHSLDVRSEQRAVDQQRRGFDIAQHGTVRVERGHGRNRTRELIARPLRSGPVDLVGTTTHSRQPRNRALRVHLLRKSCSRG